MSSPYTIIIHRNIKCASTIPKELIWGKPNTVLECKNCIHYASYKNVLVGICYNCAITYGYYYGAGFNKTKDYKNSSFSNEFLFGGINPAEIDFSYLPNNEYTQVAIENEDAYSVYNLAQTSQSDFDILINNINRTSLDNYGWQEFKNKYSKPNDENDENIDILINKINELRLQFNQWSPEFLERCLEIENAFKNNSLQNENNLLYFEEPFEIKKQCAYCKQYKVRKDLKKCGKCKEVRYCSLICQKRHWNCEYDAHRQTCGRASLEVGAEVVEEAIEESSDEVSVEEVSLEDAIENIDIADID
jgi:hypothetical protein